MLTSKVKYIGDLRTECTHLSSGVAIVTDAPVDNKGKGSSFSPTDLLATSFASCMLTIIGIHCEVQNLNFEKGEASIKKIMASNPRRIGCLEIELNLSGNNWDEKTAQKIIQIGKACPVAKTLGENIEIKYTFIV